MPNIFNKREAIAFLGIDEKLFDNYFRHAHEIPFLERNNGRGQFRFNEDQLRNWKESFQQRTVNLTKEDYALALDFALAQHFRSYVQSDFGTGRQREFGQKITNWVKGQLGEIAVKKFLHREFGLEVMLDFDIHDEIVPQDIISVVKNGKTRPPEIGVGIKASKPKNAFLILGANEINIPSRRSEIYIYTRPDIPDDHLLRIAKEKIIELVNNQQHYPVYQEQIPAFSDIPCEIAGWCHYSELKEVTSIPGQEFEGGTRFVRASGLLNRSKNDWEELVRQL